MDKQLPPKLLTRLKPKSENSDTWCFAIRRDKNVDVGQPERLELCASFRGSLDPLASALWPLFGSSGKISLNSDIVRIFLANNDKFVIIGSCQLTELTSSVV